MKTMNYTNTVFPVLPKFLLVVALYLFFPLSLSIQAKDVPGIPKPDVPVSQTGKYREILEKMEFHLQNDEHQEFYTAAYNFLAANKKERYAISRYWAETAEEATAIEWIYYYVVITPFVPTEIAIRKMMEKPLEFKAFQDDIRAKNEVFSFLFIDITPSPNHVESYQRSQGLLGKPEIFPKQTPEFTERRAVYLAALVQSLTKAHAKAQEEYAKVKYVPDPNYKAPKYSRDTLEEYREYEEELRKHPDPARIRQDGQHRRQIDIISLLPSKGTVVRRFVYGFPRNGVKVQEYLRKAGYATDEECAEAIATIFPMTKETAYLYEGLKLEKIKGKK